MKIKRKMYDGFVTYYGSDKIVEVGDYTEKKEELRGVWFSTVGNIDIPKIETIEGYKKYLDGVIEKCKEFHLNTVIFQVRPSSDTFYPSKLNPWSSFITGEQGKDPGFDVFGYFVNKAKENGITTHAWINPYRISGVKLDDLRITKDEYLDTLASNNFARLRKDLVIMSRDSKLILDPASTEVMEFVSDSIIEIAKNYDIKAVHIDDYFYPYDPIRDPDEYKKYKDSGYKSLGDFRRGNVDKMIEMIHNKLNKLDKKVEFGISPFGILRTNTRFSDGKTGDKFWEYGSNNHESCLSCYDALYADVYKWMEKKWIDYVVPQNYFDFDNTKIDKEGNEYFMVKYADLADWWSKAALKTNCKLYMGQALYRYGSENNWKDIEEIPNQLRYNESLPNVSGTVFFTYSSFVKEDNEILIKGRNELKKLWVHDAKEI